MFEFLFGKKKTASVASPASAATTATVNGGANATATAVLEPELPELEKVRKSYSKPQLPRDEEVIKGDIDALLSQRAATVQTKNDAVARVNGEIGETKRLADKAMTGLLAIEADLKASIIAKRDEDIKAHQGRIAKLESDCAQACKELDAKVATLTIEKNVRPIDLKFPRIDMSFLQQKRRPKDKDFDLPKFGMFSIDAPQCTLKVTASYYSSEKAQTTTPPAYAKHLDLSALMQYAERMRQYYGNYTYTVNAEATFKGAIPPAIRELLVDARKTFQQVYLVNEPEWKVQEVAVPFSPPRDPLVIGCRDGIYWLIASFDTTPAEEYIRREFTQGELKDVRG